MDSHLKDFIAHARKKGMDHSTIRVILLSSGWKEREIAEALTAQTLDMPVPVPPDKGGAREAFFHLLTFAALYTAAINVILLLCRYINKLFPDPALESYVYDNSSEIRWSLAAVIVAYPVYIWLSKVLCNEMKEHPDKAASGIRRWLTYLTLFVAAGTIMGDIITLIFYLLEGELSIRFILKVFVIFVIAGSGFFYYLQSLKIHPGSAAFRRLGKSFFLWSLVVVIVTVIWGAFIAGSPVTERSKKFDDRRVDDLRTISEEVFNIVYEGRRPAPNENVLPSKPLPKSLQEVKDNALYEMPDIIDPQTGEPYEYMIIDDYQFDLCATFSQNRSERYDVQWNHGPGENCFSFDARNPYAKTDLVPAVPVR